MLMGIGIAKKAMRDALSSADNAIAEVTYGLNTDKVRAKKFVRVKGRTYLIGLECECNIKAAAK
jgi:hypothetical protein